jgi:hypothetical protein
MVLVVACLVAACGSPAPSGPGSSGSAGGSTAPSTSAAIPSAAVGAPGTIIGFDDTDDPSAASHAELDLVHEARDSAGMPALLGASGPAAFTTLDATEASFGFKTLQDAAAQPLALGGGYGLASVAGDVGSPVLPRADVDISLFADSGFTASAIMSMYADLVSRAGDAGSGGITRNEPRDETDAAGNHQHVDIRMTMSVRTGGGKVSAEINMSATDRITGPDGQLIGTYTSSANGHFDVNACPDDDGVAEGTYSFAASHAMNDAGVAPAKADRGVSAPFKLIDDETAHLIRIEADMSLAADASGPGTAAGPGPTSAFDWQASDHLHVSMPARGGSPFDLTGIAPTVTGTGGQGATGSLFISAAMAQLFLAEVGKKAQDFWRSGQCIELKPSDDTRKVQPNEKIELTVKSMGKFDHKEIAKPITAKFTGAKSLDPNGTPVDEPAKFTFTAGPNKDDKGTIDLEQISKRGIGKRQVVFTVDAPALQAKVDGRVLTNADGNRYDAAIHLKPTDLTPGDDGAFHAHATVSWTTTYTPPTADCKPVTYTGTFETDITVTVDPQDPTSVVFKATFIPGVLKPEVLHCTGADVKFYGGTSLGSWATLGTPHTLVLGQPLKIPSPAAFGTASNTVTITKKPSK